MLLVSESAVCRAPLAAALLRRAAAHSPALPPRALRVDAAASCDYCEGQGVAESCRLAAEALGVDGECAAHEARTFDAAADADFYDLILCVDGSSAADVLKEICVFDIVERSSRSTLVRRLGEFGARGKVKYADLDVDDALYGNMGGQDEVDAAMAAAEDMADMCAGVVAWLETLADGGDGDNDGVTTSLRERVAAALGELPETQWLVPPMLQSSNPSADVSRATNAAASAPDSGREFDWGSL